MKLTLCEDPPPFVTVASFVAMSDKKPCRSHAIMFSCSEKYSKEETDNAPRGKTEQVTAAG